MAASARPSWSACPTAQGVPRVLWAGGEAPPLPPLHADAWRWLEVHSGVPRIVAATAEQFVPQMLNLELVGGVDFQKGCYPGQEVVARSQYRGTLKRRTYLVDSAAALAAGRRCSTATTRASRPAWWFWRASLGEGPHAALVELKMAALADGHAARRQRRRAAPERRPPCPTRWTRWPPDGRDGAGPAAAVHLLARRVGGAGRGTAGAARVAGHAEGRASGASMPAVPARTTVRRTRPR